MDADEFLNIHIGKGYLNDLVSYIGNRQGILLAWRIFGDNGQVGLKTRCISNDFTGAGNAPLKTQYHIKTLFRYSPKKLFFSTFAFPRPRISKNENLSEDDFLSGHGTALIKGNMHHQLWLAGEENSGCSNAPDVDFSWKVAQLNHYAVKTPELFKLKQLRGRGFYRKLAQGASPRVCHTDKYYDLYNRNEGIDVSILRFEKETTKLIAEILSAENVRHAYEHTLEKTKASISVQKTPSMTEKLVHEEAPAVEVLTVVEDVTQPEFSVPSLTMPKAEGKLVAKLYSEADVILEYGSGGSTMIAASQSHSLVMTVENDEAWAKICRGFFNVISPMQMLKSTGSMLVPPELGVGRNGGKEFGKISLCIL